MPSSSILYWITNTFKHVSCLFFKHSKAWWALRYSNHESAAAPVWLAALWLITWHRVLHWPCHHRTHISVQAQRFMSHPGPLPIPLQLGLTDRSWRCLQGHPGFSSPPSSTLTLKRNLRTTWSFWRFNKNICRLLQAKAGQKPGKSCSVTSTTSCVTAGLGRHICLDCLLGFVWVKPCQGGGNILFIFLLQCSDFIQVGQKPFELVILGFRKSEFSHAPDCCCQCWPFPAVNPPPLPDTIAAAVMGWAPASHAHGAAGHKTFRLPKTKTGRQLTWAHAEHLSCMLWNWREGGGGEGGNTDKESIYIYRK